MAHTAGVLQWLYEEHQDILVHFLDSILEMRLLQRGSGSTESDEWSLVRYLKPQRITSREDRAKEVWDFKVSIA